MAKHKQSLLAKNKAQVTQFNKVAVIVIVAVISLALLYIIVSAFVKASDNNSNLTPKSTNLGKSQKSSLPTSPQHVLQSLPTSYAQKAKIDSILQRRESQSLPKALVQQLTSLQHKQADLKAQLTKLKASHANHSDPSSRGYDQEASSSALFFPGGAPTKKQQDKKPAGKPSKDKAGSAKGSSAGKQNDYQAQNMQDEKLSFMSGKVDQDIYNKNTLQQPVSKYILQAGSSIPAILQTQINSNNPGMITAIVRHNVYDSINGNYLLIPKGSRLIGAYSSKIAYGQYQIQAKFLRLIRPDGSSIVLPNQPAVDSKGVSGLSDEVNNHWGQVIGASTLSAVFNMPAIVASNQMNSNLNAHCTDGNCVYSPSLGHTLAASSLQSVGQTASQVGSKLTEKSLNIQPTIVIHSGYQFSIMVTRDTILPPYQSN